MSIPSTQMFQLYVRHNDFLIQEVDSKEQETTPLSAEPEKVALLDKNNAFIFVPKKDLEQFRRNIEESSSGIFGAYQKGPKLFEAMAPLHEFDDLLKRGSLEKNFKDGDPITDEQAKVIFPLFSLEKTFNLHYYPNLTGACLAFLPKSVTQLTIPPHTTDKHLSFLQKERLPRLEFLLFYYPLSNEEGKLSDLKNLSIKRLYIQEPLLFQFAPESLEELTLVGSECQDKELADYLKRAKQLKTLELICEDKITINSLYQLPYHFASLTIRLCPCITEREFCDLVEKKQIVTSRYDA